MKKIYITMCIAALAMTACGGNGSKTAATEDNTEQTTEATETAAPETAGDEAAQTSDGILAEMKEASGLMLIPNDKVTAVKVRKSGEKEYMVTSPVADDIDGEAVQREYFNACAKLADGNSVYGYHMNGTRGDDKFKDYDSYVKYIKANGDYAKAQYGYDYNGKPVKVYCSVSFGDFGLTVKME